MLKSELLFIIIPETKISCMKYHEDANLTSHKFRTKRIIYEDKNNKKDE